MPLKIIQDNKPDRPKGAKESPSTRMSEAQARLEREWLTCPEKFAPQANALELQRLERIWEVLQQNMQVAGLHAVDVGCGIGSLTDRLEKAGAIVTAVDIAENALKEFKKQFPESNADTIRTALPLSILPDNAYDLVLCADVLAEVHPKDRRLALAELSRLMKPTSTIILSSSLDIYSDDVLESFVALTETEFTWSKWAASYHALYIQLLNLLKAPQIYASCRASPDVYQKEWRKRKGFSQKWLACNSSAPLCYLWKAASRLSNLLEKALKNSPGTLHLLEKLTRLLKGERGISHIILFGKRKELIDPVVEQDKQAAAHDRPPFRKERKWE